MSSDFVVWRSPPARIDVFIGGSPAALGTQNIESLEALLGSNGLEIFAQAERDGDGLAWRDRRHGTGFSSFVSWPQEQQAGFAAAIRPTIAKLVDLLNHPQVGHIAAALLTIESRDAMLWNGQRALLAGWGGWPAGARDGSSAYTLFASTIGAYAPLNAPPLIQGGRPNETRGSRTGLIVPMAAAVASMVLLGLALWPGILRSDQAQTSLSPPAVRDEINGMLRERIADFDAMVKRGDLCSTPIPNRAFIDPNPAFPPPAPPATGAQPSNGDIHGSGQPTAPGRSSDAAPGMPLPPVSPRRTFLDPTSTGRPSAPAGSLAKLLDDTTVFIVRHEDENLDTGSGFFISPTQVMTNAHVTGPVGSRLQIGNRVMNRMVDAIVEERTPDNGPGRPDFAILRTVNYSNPSYLSFTTDLEPREPVVAVGFPGIVIEFDRAYAKILQGDQRAIPETVFSDGTIMVVQNRETDLPFVHHLAYISQGNSGGPLADACGRVVGINSLIGNEGNGTNRTNVSLASKGALRFLGDSGVQVTVVDGFCHLAEAPASETADRSGAPPATATPQRETQAAPPAQVPPPSGGSEHHEPDPHGVPQPGSHTDP